MADFDLERAVSDDGQCIVIDTTNGFDKYNGRLLAADLSGEYPIVVVYCRANKYVSVFFKHNFKNEDETIYLENVWEKFTVWVLPYRHKTRGEIKLSTKLSLHDYNGLLQDIRRLGHTILDAKTINMSEGNFDYKNSFPHSDLPCGKLF